MPHRPLLHGPQALVLSSLLVLGAVAQAAQPSLASCRALSEAAQRLACYDALPLPAVVPAAPTAAVPAAVAPAVAPEAAFGLPAATQTGPAAIESRWVGAPDLWKPRQEVTLANGQVWQISDGSSGPIEVREPRVTVRRGSFGAFYLDIEGVNQSPRVRRLK